MQIIIRNAVREAATRDLRRAAIGRIQVAPSIGGQRLPPRRSRKVHTHSLDDSDLRLIVEMMRAGVLRVFRAHPFEEFDADGLAVVTGIQIRPEPVVEQEREVIEPVSAPEVEHEEDAAEEAPVEVADEAPPAEEPAPEAAPEEPVAEDPEPEEPASAPEPIKYTRVELRKLRNAQLREILDGMPGSPGHSGLRKAQLVDLVLSEQE